MNNVILLLDKRLEVEFDERKSAVWASGLSTHERVLALALAFRRITVDGEWTTPYHAIEGSSVYRFSDQARRESNERTSA